MEEGLVAGSWRQAVVGPSSPPALDPLPLPAQSGGGIHEFSDSQVSQTACAVNVILGQLISLPSSQPQPAFHASCHCPLPLLQFGHIFARGETREAALRNLCVVLRDVVVRGEVRTIVDYALDMLQVGGRAVL